MSRKYSTKNDDNDAEEEVIDDEEKRNNALAQWMKVNIKLSSKKQKRNTYGPATSSTNQDIKIERDIISEALPTSDIDDSQTGEVECSTDAFGDIKFVGYGQKIAKFARVDYTTSMETIINLITVQWNLPLPKLFISIIGGRKKFQLESYHKAFGRGLVKAAKSTGAWIISAGLHSGVVKYIGKTIQENESSSTGNNKVVTISIASWNDLQNKDSLTNKNGSWPAEYHIENASAQSMYALDPNHSHFILVDNGSTEIRNEDIEFRKKLENFIKTMKPPGRESKMAKIPVVAVMIEGGPGALKAVRDSILRGIPVVIVKGSGRVADILAYAYQKMLEDTIRHSKSLPKKLRVIIREKIFKMFGKTGEIESLVNRVKDAICKPELITLFEIDSAEDFDVTILKAVFKANNDKLENLWLALEWNRIDIAKSEIFADGACWPPENWIDFMLFALREDRVDFVKFFMECGISLIDLSTKKNIEDLYNMGSKDISIKDGVSVFYKILQQKTGKNCLAEIYESKLPITTKLFLWAIILNRKEMASIFWKGGMEALPSALIANKVLKSLKKKCTDYDKRIKFQEHADLYEERAIGVLNECYYEDEKQTLDLLLLQRNTWYKTSCMQIAFNANNKKFVSQAACQSLLTNVWMGSISSKNKILMLLLCTLCPLFIFLIKFDEEEQGNNEETNKQNHSQESKAQQSCIRKMFSRCVTFYCTPFIKFLTNLIFYAIFLIIYSYVLLVELKPQISYLEWLLLVWVIGIFTEEIHQMLVKSSVSLWMRFINYINDFWNIVDVITISLFIFGVILRFLKFMDATRVILNLNLISFYIRILYMLSSHRHLGPKLIMIKRMIQDLGYFIVIMFVFMIAFGITSQSILHPSTPVSYDLFKEVFRKAYFHMYGELFLEEYEENIKSKPVMFVAPFLMCIYILIMHILLLNLLIAMFSFTFQKVQEMSYQHWSFQRYDLVYEFCVRPPLPPPFILLSNFYQVCRYLYRKARNKYQRHIVFSKQFNVNESKHLILWENQMVDSYLSKKDVFVSDDLYEKVISSANRIDQLTSKVEELQHNIEEKVNEINTSLQELTKLVKKEIIGENSS